MTDIKNPTDVLFHADLAEREFGSALLSVSRLTTWVQDKDLELVTVPPLAGYRFVQAEALLCAIERGANSLTPEQAAKIVQADPILSKHRAVTNPDGYIDPITSRWLLGADAHLSWRRLLENAIEKQELTLLNFASKLPIQAAPTQKTETTPAGTAKVWTLERKEQARAVMNKYKAGGIKDFAARTAKEFGVTATRLNAVLSEKKTKKPVKRAGFWGE